MHQSSLIVDTVGGGLIYWSLLATNYNRLLFNSIPRITHYDIGVQGNRDWTLNYTFLISLIPLNLTASQIFSFLISQYKTHL
jgi:hypothetical protein